MRISTAGKQENRINRNKHFVPIKMSVSSTLLIRYGFKGTVVNRELLFLHEGLLENYVYSLFILGFYVGQLT